MIPRDERIPNPSASAVLAWTSLALGLTALAITGWRWSRHRRGIGSWTGCEPKTPTGGWIDHKTGEMPAEVVSAVYDMMAAKLDADPSLGVDELVRHAVWELAQCDEQSLTAAARGQLHKVAQVALADVAPGPASNFFPIGKWAPRSTLEGATR